MRREGGPVSAARGADQVDLGLQLQPARPSHDP